MKINRRQLLNFALTGTGITLVAHWGLNNHQSQLSLAKSASSLPQIYKSQNGLLEVNLTAHYTPVNLGTLTAYFINL